MFSNYAFTCNSAMIMVIQKIALKVAGKMHLFIFFFFFFLIRKKHGLKHLRVKPTDTLHIHTLSSVHPASARFCLLLAHADSSPVVPSHGTGTILLCGSPAGPGQGKHPSPCCFEAVKK